MSKESIRANIVEKLQSNLGRASKDNVSDSARAILQHRHVAQCLVLREHGLEVMAEAQALAIGGFKNSAEKQNYKNYVLKKMRGMHKSRPNTLRTRIWNDFMKSEGLVWGKDIVYTGESSFASVKTLLINVSKNWSKENGYEGRYSNLTNIHLDHGLTGANSALVGGGATGGFLAEKAARERGYSKAQFDASVEWGINELMNSSYKRFSKDAHVKSTIYNIIVNWEQIVDKNTGKIKANAGILIEPVRGPENMERSNVERMFTNIAIKTIENVFKKLEIPVNEIEGSSNLDDKITTSLHSRLTKGLKKKGYKVVGTSNKKVKAKTKTKTKVSAKTKSQTVSVRNIKGHKVPTLRKPESRSGGGGDGISPGSLLAVLNTRMKAALEDRMVKPSLVYRTGRFAESVKITGIVQTPQGFPSIHYNYMEYPYRIFSAAGKAPWNMPPQRHPERIIEGAIREIAAEFALGKFYVRREPL